ncbi:MAG: ABC transporter permease [Anaerolineae bacterium]
MKVRKGWLVAKHEYLNRVRKRSFLIAVLGFPLLMAGVMAVSIILILAGIDDRPVGYVDQAGFVNTSAIPTLQEDLDVEFRAYPDEEAAQEDLEGEVIQAYYVIPGDYLETQEVSLYYWQDAPDETIMDDFDTFLEANLIAMQPEEARSVLSQDIDLTIRSLDGEREISSDNILSIILPFVMGFLLFFAITISGGYMLEAVGSEKENRTVEIITTSLSPEEFIGGKAIGLIGVSLTQMAIWTVTLLVGLVIAGRFFEPLRGLAIPWEILGLTVLYFLPTFALMTGVMTTIGAMTKELQQGQQISGIINLLFIFPVFFAAVIFTRPDSPFLVVLSLFPTTSFLTIMMRWGISSIPLWQMIASWLIVVGAAIASVWLAARVFRMGMLRYGQQLKLKDIVAGLSNGYSGGDKGVADA